MATRRGVSRGRGQRRLSLLGVARRGVLNRFRHIRQVSAPRAGFRCGVVNRPRAAAPPCHHRVPHKCPPVEIPPAWVPSSPVARPARPAHSAHPRPAAHGPGRQMPTWLAFQSPRRRDRRAPLAYTSPQGSRSVCGFLGHLVYPPDAILVRQLAEHGFFAIVDHRENSPDGARQLRFRDDPHHARRPVAATVAHQAMTYEEAGKLGGRGKKAASHRSSFGTTADYLARRIARDRPDILQRMKAGAFPRARDGATPDATERRRDMVQAQASAHQHLSIMRVSLCRDHGLRQSTGAKDGSTL